MKNKILFIFFLVIVVIIFATTIISGILAAKIVFESDLPLLAKFI